MGRCTRLLLFFVLCLGGPVAGVCGVLWFSLEGTGRVGRGKALEGVG